jgi:O-succinylbenzoic acid--CoA ligase
MERAGLRRLAFATGRAVERGGFVFLCDPAWGASERAEFAQVAREARAAHEGREDGGGGAERGWLCLSTGGTSGRVRFARHDEETLGAAARGFCGHFGLERVNAVDVLPVHHVSGFMARVRCAVSGGIHLPWAWKRLEAGELPEPPAAAGAAGGWVLSLVPTQLQRLLGDADAARRGRAADWLRRFAVVFLGGGPVWPSLADAAAREGLRVSLSYGMTETAAMVAASRPGEFAGGARSCGTALPHARVELVDEETGVVFPGAGCAGRADCAGRVGRVRITGPGVFRGYVPENAGAGGLDGGGGDGVLLTEDLAFFDARGGLNIAGRRDAVIITGGKKVLPGEVEAVLRAGGGFSDVAVVGVPDGEWGERVVACHPGEDPAPDWEAVGRAMRSLAGYKRPVRFIPLAPWPRNAQGKVSRARLLRALAAAGPE